MKILGLFLIASICLVGSCTKVFDTSCADKRKIFRSEGDRLHARIRAEDYKEIYEQASPRIKECYSVDSFSAKMASLVGQFRVVDPELRFKVVRDEDQDKSDSLGWCSDMFIGDFYFVGDEDNGLREQLSFKYENDKLRLFAYRVLDMSQTEEEMRSNVSANMIACPKSD